MRAYYNSGRAVCLFFRHLYQPDAVSVSKCHDDFDLKSRTVARGIFPSIEDRFRSLREERFDRAMETRET